MSFCSFFVELSEAVLALNQLLVPGRMFRDDLAVYSKSILKVRGAFKLKIVNIEGLNSNTRRCTAMNWRWLFNLHRISSQINVLFIA